MPAAKKKSKILRRLERFYGACIPNWGGLQQFKKCAHRLGRFDVTIAGQFKAHRCSIFLNWLYNLLAKKQTFKKVCLGSHNNCIKNQQVIKINYCVINTKL
jgi:hypothetical protein